MKKPEPRILIPLGKHEEKPFPQVKKDSRKPLPEKHEVKKSARGEYFAPPAKGSKQAPKPQPKPVKGGRYFSRDRD